MLAVTTRSGEREATCERIVGTWAAEHDVDLRLLDSGQRWVIFAALQAMSLIGPFPPLRRLLCYVLAHCGMELRSSIIAAVTGVSSRAIRGTRALSPKQLVHSVRTPESGHRSPKLGPEHAGAVAKYLVQHRGARVDEILAFISADLNVSIDRKTLRTYIARYGLGCLRDEVHAVAPLFSAPRSTAARSC
jgi:hypothetical protein